MFTFICYVHLYLYPLCHCLPLTFGFSMVSFLQSEGDEALTALVRKNDATPSN
jgi:hypothetical protein